MSVDVSSAKELALAVKRNMSMSGRARHIALVVEKIMSVLETDGALKLTTYEPYRVAHRKCGKDAVKVIRAVLRELGVDVSHGKPKIARMRKHL